MASPRSLRRAMPALGSRLSRRNRRGAMPQAAALATDQHVNSYPIDEFLVDIAGIAATTDIADLKRNSRDYYWYSPILADLLKNKVADVVVTPVTRAKWFASPPPAPSTAFR